MIPIGRIPTVLAPAKFLSFLPWLLCVTQSIPGLPRMLGRPRFASTLEECKHYRDRWTSTSIHDYLPPPVSILERCLSSLINSGIERRHNYVVREVRELLDEDIIIIGDSSRWDIFVSNL